MSQPKNVRRTRGESQGRFPRGRFLLALALGAGLVGLVPAAAQAATTYVVDQGSGVCSDAGSGTPAQPYCSITPAIKKAVSGDTVTVAAGTYHEQVVPVAGVSVTGAGPSSVLEATDDLSGVTWASGGTPTSWSTVLPATALPAMATANGTTLTKATTLATLTTGGWYYDSPTKTLTVDLGAMTGPAPADAVHILRSYGIRVQSGSLVSGFAVKDPAVAGVQFDPGTTGATAQDLSVTGSKAYGVFVNGGSGDKVQRVDSSGNTSIGILLRDSSGSSVLSSTTSNNHNHGVSVQGGVNDVVRDVTSFGNTSPNGPRIATGIDINKSATGPSLGATVERNTTYGNADSGIEIYQGSNNAVVRRNLTYDNGDHGIDISAVTGSDVVSNTVVGNANPGINVEGGATGTTVRDNIAAENATGSTGTHGDLRVDTASVTGTSADHDLLFQTSGAVVEWATIDYPTLAAFRTAQPAQEVHGRSAAPQFTNRAGGDFTPMIGSPAIDAADASVTSWLAADRTGASPVDQPTVADTGAGTPTYADLGAVELTQVIPLPDNPPTAQLSVTPAAPHVGDVVTLDASASTDDNGIVTYAFACGNGVTQSGAAKTATCTYATAATFPASVTVTDAKNQSSTKSVQVSVSPALQQISAALTAGPARVRQLAPVALNASGSRPASGATVTGYRFSCGTGDTHAVQAGATMRCRYAKVGTYVARVTVTDSQGHAAVAATHVVVVKAPPPVAHLTLSTHRVGKRKAVFATGRHSVGGTYWPLTRAVISCAGHRHVGKPGMRVACRWSTKGWHTVRLTVWNNLGRSDSVVQRVFVRRH